MGEEEWKTVATNLTQMADISRAERGITGRRVKTGLPEGTSRSKLADLGAQDRATVESYSKKNEASTGDWEQSPLITEIAGEKTGMGRLIYELPANPALKVIRDAERKIFSIFKKDEVDTTTKPPVSESTAPASSEKQRTATEKAFLNFCKAHREGHIEGFRNVSQSDLLESVLANAEGKPDISGRELAYQAATTFEAAGDDATKRTELRTILDHSEVWKSRVVQPQATKDLEIPGINEAEMGLFPDARMYVVPPSEATKVDKLLNPVLEGWKKIITDSTEKRAKRFINQHQPNVLVNKFQRVAASLSS